jgi:hypothetical protein
MLITIQFPFIDSRTFVSNNTQKLVVPSWLIPVPDHDFIRSFGIIRRRPLGGLTGWVGESYICEAHNAICFQGMQPFFNGLDKLIKFKVVFRRLFFDGLSVGKFEIGLAAWYSEEESFSPFELSADEMRQLLLHVLKLPVLVRDSREKFIQCQLWQAGQPIARLYAASTSLKQDCGRVNIEDWWIQPCEPLILLITDQEDLVVTYREDCKFLKIPCGVGTLSHHIIPLEGKNIPMWLIEGICDRFSRLSSLESLEFDTLRQLRIFLLRLHAEQKCLRGILRNISTGKLEISKRSEKSRILQEYLNQATKRIKRLNEHADKRVEADVGELARKAEDYFAPGERDALFNALKIIDIEKNIFHKVENFVSPSTIIKNQFTGAITMTQNKGNVNISDTQGNVSGVAAAENQTMTGVAIGAISGSVTNTINQLPTSSNPDIPGIKELLAQLQAAIEAESELPDEDKAEALEQVKTLAEAGQKPEDNVLQKAAKTSMKILKGTVASLPDAAKLAESCAKLLPAIATLLALV